MAINTLITLKDALTAFANGHGQLQGRIIFEADDHRSAYITEESEFPILFVAPISVQIGRAMNTHSLRCYVYERINDDRTDVIENANDTSLILRDIRVWWNDYGVDDIQIIEDVNAEFGSDKELDNLVGYFSDIRFELPSHGRCDVPVDVQPIPVPSCADASYLVEYVNGTPIESGTIPSGGSATIQVPDPSVCADATYSITDDDLNVLYSGSIPSGGNLDQLIQDSTVTITDDSLNTLYTLSVNAEGSASQVIQDSTAVLKNTDNTILSTTSINAEASADIVAPDGHVHIKKENDGTIANVFVPSGTTETYDVADNDISVNGVLEFDIHATDPLDIRLRDTTNSVVTPNSVTESGNHAVIVIPDTDIEVNGVAEGSVVAGSTVDIQLSDSLGVVTPTSVTQVGNDFQIVLPDAPPAVTRSTATLMRTAQTTVYRTGDDADTSSEGRPTDFLTLDAAPLHNDGTATINTTTSRFTDELGGQTYTNDIVLDWSTWNGSTLLGYYRVINNSNVNWNTAIDNCLAVTVGAFTTGWRLPNRGEMFNIVLHEGATLNYPLNYAPFNISSPTIFYTSTTNAATTTQCYSLTNNGGSTLGSTSKTSNGRYFPCRTFSLSLLNVLS